MRTATRTCARAGRHVLALLALAAPTGSARAYSYASPLAPGCHEAITLSALRQVRDELSSAAPLPPEASDRVWIADLPLDLPPDARDLGAASLIVGVRDNDLKGRSGLDTAELALVHGDPHAQLEHCLRRPEHDEPDGSEAALAECRAFIRERVDEAVHAGFDALGHPDPAARVRVAVYLAFAGETQVPMPRAYVELGRALHALQDSFSHAVRSDDGLRVRTLLNWIDFAHEHHDALRDGPAHRAALDRCEHLDALRTRRLELAIEASTALLRAALDPSLAADAKLAHTDAVLDRYLGYEPGCGADNDFCGAPELAYAASDAGCSVVSRTRAPRLSAALVALAALLLFARRGRWMAPGTRAARVGGACMRAPRGLAPVSVCALLVLVVPAPTAAQAGPAARVRHERSEAPRLALSSAVSAAVDQAGAAAALGGRFAASERWRFGLDAAWSPWASIDTGRLRPGTLDGYATVVWRSPMTRDLALRVSGHAGVSHLLFDVYGAAHGSVGPYVGLSLLGLEVSISRRVRLILEPADFAMAVPHVTGIPLVRHQYRATIGIEVWL